MDAMYTTVQTASKMAKKAHNKEKRIHVIFKEMDLFRIKPADEIAKIDQESIYGWTVPKWIPDLHEPNITTEEMRQESPWGDDCFIRKQFYRNGGYYKPEVLNYHPRVELELYNKYTEEEIRDCLIYGQWR